MQRRSLLKSAAALAAFEPLLLEAQEKGESTTLKDIPLGPNVKLTIERRGQIILFGINRPNIQNRIDPETSESLGRAYYDYEHDATLRVAILFGQTARHDQTQTGIHAFERVEMVHTAVGAALRVIANGARVEHDHVRFLGGRSDAIACRGRAFRDVPGVGFVHLAAESLDVNTGHPSFRTSRGALAIPAPVGVARSH